MDFYASLSRYYDVLFPPNPKQINFLAAHCPAQGKVLDIGAGTGGYAAALAAAGADVEALEIGAMVPYLQRTAAQKGFSAREMGMEQIRDLPEKSYNLVYCIGNTLVHLENAAQVTEFLKDCKRLLLPGGQLILQIVNYDRVIAGNQTELPVITVADPPLTLIRHYEIGNGSVQFTTRLSCGDEQWLSETRLLALKQAELAQCLHAADFKAVLFQGDFEGAPWNSASPATVVIAQV